MVRKVSGKKGQKTTAKKKKTTVRKKKTQKKSNDLLWLALRVFMMICAVAFLFVAGYVGYCFVTLPDVDTAVSRTRQPSTTVIADNGNEIYTFGNSFAEVVYLDTLPYYVPAAVIDVEDRRFYSHFGFDVFGFARASVTNLIKHRYAQGASTITQQVAKNLFLTPQKNIKRKVQELLLAFWLESKFTKEQILTLYLNRVYLGAGTYGIEAAANRYFGKTSSDLSLKEAAILAGMLKAPSRYNPIYYPQKALDRSKVVLNLMLEHGTITQAELNKALKETLHDPTLYKVEGARHFADMVYHEVNAYVGEREQDIYVSTTLDQDLQQKAEWLLRETVKTNRDKNVTDGAVVILDYTGAIRALVGGVNYSKSQFNRATQALRQPGSAFKPFVYLTAIQNGWSKNDLIEDAPIQIGKWKPENYDKKYYGQVSLQEALIRSLNVATVQLSTKLNRSDIIRNARKMGISTPIADTPAMVLGAAEVKVIDMATAYTALANGGYAVWPYAITEIYSKDGRQLYQRQAGEPIRVLDEQTVEQMRQMLEAVIQYGTGRRAKLPVFAAGKTGTTQDYREAWFVGWTDRYVAAVWVGNDDNSPMKNVGGGQLPAQIWQKIMLTTLN
jgi:penicillin-binding protein 1A